MMTGIKYFCEGLTPEMMEIAERELGETEEVKRSSLEELRMLLEHEPDLYPCMEDAFLIRYLRYRKYNIKETHKAIVNYYKFKAKYSRIYADFLPSELKHVLESDYFVMLPYRDQNNVGVGVIRFENYNGDIYNPDESISAIVTCQETFLRPETTQVVGFSCIYDLSKYSFSMAVRHVSPAFIFRVITAVKDCLTCRLKGIHIINPPIYLNLAVSIFKHFLPGKLRKRVYLHGSNLKSLHQYISPDILPEEYGGKQGPISTMGEEFRSRILSDQYHVIKMNKYGYRGETLENLKKGF